MFFLLWHTEGLTLKFLTNSSTINFLWDGNYNLKPQPIILSEKQPVFFVQENHLTSLPSDLAKKTVLFHIISIVELFTILCYIKFAFQCQLE